MAGFGATAWGIAVQGTGPSGATDPAGTTAGGIDLTRTAGRTGRSLDPTLTPIRTPLPSPAALSRMVWDSEKFNHLAIALRPATEYANRGRHCLLDFSLRTSDVPLSVPRPQVCPDSKDAPFRRLTCS
jgi:hypothetical protein